MSTGILEVDTVYHFDRATNCEVSVLEHTCEVVAIVVDDNAGTELTLWLPAKQLFAEMQRRFPGMFLKVSPTDTDMILHQAALSQLITELSSRVKERGLNKIAVDDLLRIVKSSCE